MPNDEHPKLPQHFDLTNIVGHASHASQQSQASHNHRTLGLTQKAYDDLKKSGLTDEYIKKMRVRQSINLEQSTTNADDYVIPYFKSTGEQLQGYYRERIFRSPSATNPKPPKYIQPEAGGPTRIYFPPNWQDELRFLPYLVITEGEKKTASAAQYGIPTIGLGGVDSWRTKQIELEATDLVRLPPPEGSTKPSFALKISDELGEKLYNGQVEGSQLAPEFLELIQEAARLEKTVYICFDTDKLTKSVSEDGTPQFGTKLEVNRSAFNLAMFLIDHGITKIQYVNLPPVVPPHSRDGKPDKTGIDDFIVARGPEALKDIILNGEHSFPTLGNIRFFVNQTLNQGRVKRRDYLKVARAVVADLDRYGQRYRTGGGVYYYFEYSSKTMMPVSLSAQELRDIRLTEFGKLIFDKYGISSRDESILKEVGDQFVNTVGIKTVEARRVSYAAEDALYYQLDDGTLLKASATTGVSIHDNGYDDVLFIRNLVEPINLTRETLKEKLDQEKKATISLLKDKNNRWLQAFRTMQIQAMDGFTLEETHMLLSAHFFLNPFFRRWNNLMLPMELTIAEPGSGKSLFYTLRKFILTGRTELNRLPQDVRDWYANITDSDGMWVADNVGKIPNQIRQTYSDELARLITDLNPSVSMRKLYTTADDVRMQVPCTFAITAINNPFTNEDIIQRSLMINMKAIPRGERDGEWFNKQLDETNGVGRTGWILHHMLISVRFLSLYKKHWNKEYKARHRLINYEQSLLLMGVALGFEHATMERIVAKLSRSIQTVIAKNNPVIEGLFNFAHNWVADTSRAEKIFNAQDIVDWALMSEEFSDIQVLTNSRVLGRYMMAHAYDIHESAGIYSVGKREGKSAYRVDLGIHNPNKEGNNAQ